MTYPKISIARSFVKIKEVGDLCTQVIINDKNLDFELKKECLIGQWLLVFLEYFPPNHPLESNIFCSYCSGGL